MTAAPAPLARTSGRRGAELALLLFGVLLAAAGQACVVIARTNALNSRIAADAGVLLVLALVMHLAVRRFAPYADPLLLPLVVMLAGLGLTLIGRIDDSLSGTNYAPLQLVWLAIGTGVFVVVLGVVRDHRTLARFGYTAALVGLVLLMLPAVLPASISEVNGARVWIRVSGFSLQPSEIAKVLLVIFFAAYLVAKRDVMSLVTRSFLGLQLPRARDLGPVLLAWVASLAVLSRENDLGQSLLLFGVFVAMLYVATQRSSWLVIGLVLFAGGAYFAYHAFAHVRERFDIWLHAFKPSYVHDQSYQLVQGLYGFGGGGLLGTGLGRGHPQIVPFARTDFVFAALGEELGLVGVVAVLVCYGLIVERGLRAAIGVRDSFGKMLAGGLAASIALQVFVIVGGVMRLIPLTGLTTPFLSYGGSSLVANFAIIALLLRISDAARRPPPPLRDDSPYGDAPTSIVRSAEARTVVVSRVRDDAGDDADDAGDGADDDGEPTIAHVPDGAP
ncbi:MAG TPA: FtsW/RodA/SpoVE family cell cycle protein [Mycobacteriales bacterium]|nr:FtsW/RodA/SpoVE family cell cycle protein [Mycobacteriales bacterium]